MSFRRFQDMGSTFFFVLISFPWLKVILVEELYWYKYFGVLMKNKKSEKVKESKSSGFTVLAQLQNPQIFIFYNQIAYLIDLGPQVTDL